MKKLVVAGEPITYEELFTEIRDGASRRVAVLGGAGYGKTTELKKLAQRMLREAAESEKEQNEEQFSIVQLLSLKDMPPKESTTLQDCLFGSDIRSADDRRRLIDWIQKNQEKAVILLDGLDQARYDTKLEHSKVSLWEEASTETLMYNLMSGNIFPNVKVIFSSREHAASTLPMKARPDLVVALAGFTQEHAMDLLLDLTEESSESSKIIEQKLGALLSMLVIPIYLIFTAVIYKYCKKKNEEMPKFVTELMAKIIGILPNNEHMQANMVSILNRLKKLAYQGMKDKRMSFDEKYLNEHGLTADEVFDLMAKVPIENMMCHRLLEKDFFYFFCHQSMEEFLAACYISEMSLDDFEKFAYDQVQDDDKFYYWSFVIQCLYGITLNSEIKLDESLHKSE